MSSITYTFRIELNLGALLPSVAGVEKTINETMHGFGFPESIVSRTTALTAELSVNRVLTVDELLKAEEIILAGIADKFPGSSPTVADIIASNAEQNTTLQTG